MGLGMSEPFPVHSLQNGRMENGIYLLTALRVGNDELSQHGPLELPRFAKVARSKQLAEALPAGAAWSDNLACHLVRIQNDGPQFLKHSGDRALARGNPPCDGHLGCLGRHDLIVQFTQGTCESVVVGSFDEGFLHPVTTVGHGCEGHADQRSDSTDRQRYESQGPENDGVHDDELTRRCRFVRVVVARGCAPARSPVRGAGIIRDGKWGAWRILCPGGDADSTHDKRQKHHYGHYSFHNLGPPFLPVNVSRRTTRKSHHVFFTQLDRFIDFSLQLRWKPGDVDAQEAAHDG